MRKAILAFICVFLVLGCLGGGGSLKEYSETRNLIGTFISVTVYAPNAESAAEAINASFAEMTRLGGELSHYSKTNKVHELNTKGFDEPVELGPELSFVLNRSLYFSAVSGGAFDVTVQPLVLLWEQMKDTNVSPADAEVKEAKSRTGYENILLSGGTASFARPGMSVTFGGIAKGYIVDAGLGVLRGHGIVHALINAGGDVGAFGGKPGGGSWTLALRNPRNESDYVTLISLRDGAVATSGDYERYFTPDKSVHHIIDPRTGYSAAPVISATVIADSATDADALATTVFVLGPKEGIELAESLQNVEALLITENKTILKTSGFKF